MSFKIQPTPVVRLNRSQLFGPGSRPEIFNKMANSAADVITLDLEDSVVPDDKEKARLNVIEAINSIDWKNKTVSVRINSLDTQFWHRDVIDLLENCSERLDNLTIPKVGCSADIYAVDALVSSVEQATARSKNVGVEIKENSNGLENFEFNEDETPELFNSDEQENSITSHQEETEEEDDLEIPAFLRRQKN